MQVKSDIIQGVINRAKTAVRNFGENAQVELPAELVKNICQNLNAERYRLAKLNKKYSALKQQVKWTSFQRPTGALAASEVRGNNMKLMSLFDGSGGFPLAGGICGVEPVYASEIEPYPIAVTKSRFPKMKHLGNVANIKGDQIDPVDIITFGSPCQDMSVAGKRAGLKHTAAGDDETTRSGMFMEAIRIIKEMRNKTNGVYPRYAIWENVPGAFSSNKGEDFRTVLEEFIRISEPNAVMPAVPQAGWAYADCISGNGWSVAYRTFDAQYWGVPQRRRRIYLVADFRGGRAGEILFKREGLRGHTAQSGTQGQETARCAKNSVGTAIGGVDRYNQSFLPGLAQTLRASGGGDCTPTVLAPVAVYCHQGNGIDRAGKCLTEYSFDSLSSNSMKSKNPHSGCRAVEIAKTLDTGYPDPSKNQGGIAIVEKIILDDQGGQQISVRTDGKSPTLMAEAHGNGIDRADTAGCNGKGVCEDKCYTLNTIDRHAVCFPQQAYNKFIQEDIGATLKASGGTYGGGSENLVAEQSFSPIRYIVRRLTPTECARLQGFPDKWGHPDKKEDFTEEEYKFWLNVRNTYAKINGKPEKEYTKAQMLTWYSQLHTDSAEYKMWGNGIALLNALYVMQGIVSKGD